MISNKRKCPFDDIAYQCTDVKKIKYPFRENTDVKIKYPFQESTDVSYRHDVIMISYSFESKMEIILDNKFFHYLDNV
jgi:hypothetical protein